MDTYDIEDLKEALYTRDADALRAAVKRVIQEEEKPELILTGAMLGVLEALDLLTAPPTRGEKRKKLD